LWRCNSTKRWAHRVIGMISGGVGSKEGKMLLCIKQAGIWAALLAFLGGTPAAAQVFVDGTTFCAVQTGSPTCSPDQGGPFSTIRAGVNATSPGGTLFVRGGLYTESVLLNKRMQLRAFDGEVTIRAPVGGSNTAVVGNALSSPVYVNLYWDANWDADNPSMPQDELDAFISALIQSSYFAGLSEYGVQAPSFGGGFLPNPLCTQKAPSHVGYYAPIKPSIIGFLQCELVHAAIPQGSQVVYNIILPKGSLEDEFGLCNGLPGASTAWHFHETPYDPVVLAAGVLGAYLGLDTDGAPGAFAGFVAALYLAADNNGPIYTIESADPQCKNFIDNLVHEMVEATSDPFPPLNVILSGTGEVADLCGDVPPSTPFALPEQLVLPANPSFPTSGRFTTSGTSGTVQVPQYWSNNGGKCAAGFADNTTPTVSQAEITGNGADITLTISGTGFGNPLPWINPREPAPLDVPYLGIQDETQGWQAGNALNSDFLKTNIALWSDTTIVVKGFFFNTGNLVMQPNDQLSYWVCNPASGKCGFAKTKLVESGSPQLKIFVENMPNVTLSYDILVDGQKVDARNWLVFSDSPTVTVTENPTQPGYFTPTFFGGCDSSGRVALKPGDNQTCTILNIATTGCSSGQHCCSGATSSLGCVAGCVADTVVCQPLCPPLPAGQICCEGPLPNGQCAASCIIPPAKCR
jgi:hypothetical protein